MMNNSKNQPQPPRFSPPSASQQDFESLSYRFIEPDEYQSLGINSDDVPMGTFAAMDHPPFLPSRVGGNAYGFGFIEKSYLDEEDIRFLESIEEDDPRELSKHAQKINEIYKKLGLLIRVSYKGFRFYLIPINLITHSLQDVKCKADEIERVIIKHVFKKNRERLEVGLLTYENDLIVHELAGRMPTMKFSTFDNLQKLGNYPGSFDLIILPKNIYEFLFNIIPESPRGVLREDHLFKHARYLIGKIYDMLDPGGEFFTIANCLWPEHDEAVEVRFTSELELKNFLIFTHLFETGSRPVPKNNSVVLRLRDLYWYLNGAYVYDETLYELLGDRSIFSLSLEEIENLPYLRTKINETALFQKEETWNDIVLPFFSELTRKQILPDYLKEYLDRNVVSNIELPGTVFLFLGEKRKPAVNVAELKTEIEASGLAGCKLELVARYKNTFSYLLNVLDRVEQLLSGSFEKISEVQLFKLRGFFESKETSARFRTLENLLNLRDDLKNFESQFNPDNLEGRETPLLENLEKMSLLGLGREILREIVLVVVGHTTLSRIALGKLPERSLSQVTSRIKTWGMRETISILRLSLLMSVAEISASLGDNLSRAQIKELFSIYENLLEKITEQDFDWDVYEDEHSRVPGNIFNRAVRVILKLFNLFEYLDNWDEIVKKGPFERDVFCNFDPARRQEIGKVITLVKAVKNLECKSRFLFPESEDGFLRTIIRTEFHGTGHLFPYLDPVGGLILLWLAVNAARGEVVNFNPLIKHMPREYHEKLIDNYRRILASIEIDDLNSEFFKEIDANLTRGPGFAFVLGTGFQLKRNRATGALDVSHVDIHASLKSLKEILDKYNDEKIGNIPLDQLRKLEDLFTSVYDYYVYAKERDLSAITNVAATAEYFISKEAEITFILEQLDVMFRNQLLEPEEIYDNFTLLLEHCPGILGYLLPKAGELTEGAGAGPGGIIGNSVLSCLKKFQALVKEDKELFQDHKVFYQIAQQEFGPFTAENVAANQFQIDKLAGMITNLKKEPSVLKAIAISFLVVDEDSLPPVELADKFGVPAKGISLLKTIFENSGILDSVIHGEAPLEVLGSITERRSKTLLDAFFIHEIIRMASNREGRLTEDFLDLCFSYYTLAEKVCSGAYNWREIEARLIEEKVKSAEAGRYPSGQEQGAAPNYVDTEREDISFRKTKLAAIERIFRLAGLLWVDYKDVLMANSGVPVTFIYRKKALRSLGLKTFIKQLQSAREIHRFIENEEPRAADYFLTQIARFNRKPCFYHFRDIPGYLSLENWMKLLLLSVKISVELCTETGRDSYSKINFRPLAGNLGLRHEILSESLNGLSFSWIVDKCTHNSLDDFEINGILLAVDREKGHLIVDFRDPIDIEGILSEMRDIKDVDELNRFYEEKTTYLEGLRFFTKDYKELLKRSFERRRRQLNDAIIERGLKNMLKSKDFESLAKNFQDLKKLGSECGFTNNQNARIKYAFEKRQAQFRTMILGDYKKVTSSVSSTEELKKLWLKAKEAISKERSFYTRDFKLEIARIFDERLAEIARKKEPKRAVK